MAKPTFYPLYSALLGAAITEYHRLGGSNNRNASSHPGSWKSEIKVLVGVDSFSGRPGGESSLLLSSLPMTCWQSMMFLGSHMPLTPISVFIVAWHSPRVPCLYVQMSLFIRTSVILN